jgi:hypothetical protein
MDYCFSCQFMPGARCVHQQGIQAATPFTPACPLFKPKAQAAARADVQSPPWPATHTLRQCPACGDLNGRKIGLEWFCGKCAHWWVA